MTTHPNRAADPFRALPAAAVVVLAWLALFPITSVDAYYHLATGRRIVEDRRIPDRGVGSGTFGQTPWHDNEWGFQLLAAVIGTTERGEDGVWTLTRTGTIGLIVMRALCLAATLALLSAHMARRDVDALSRSVALVLAAFLTFGNLFWTIRPQIFSYLGLAALAYLLERDRLGARWARWALLGVLAVWANFHGAFVIGIGLLGVEAAGEWLDGYRSTRAAEARRRAKRLTALTLLAPLAACINPHGYRQILHPFLYLLRPEIHQGNAEWSRPDFLHLPLFLLTVVLLVLGLARRPRPGFSEVLRCVVFVGLMLTAIRHLPLAAIVLAPVVAANLTDAARRGGWRSRLLPTLTGSAPWRAASAAVLTVAIVALSGAKFVGPWPRFREQPVRPMPEQAVRYIAREGVEGTGFNAYRFGGFLMYRLYPAEVAFMDGRNDLYGAFRNEVYNPILDARPGWRRLWSEAVAHHGIGWVLVDEAAPLAGRLAADPEWLMGPDGRPTVVDGEPGSSGIVLVIRDTPANRVRLPALREIDKRRAPVSRVDPGAAP